MSNKITVIMDDPVFPIMDGMVLESCGGAPQNEPGTAPRIGVLESYADSQLRSQAMSAVLGWIEDGNFTYDNLDEFVCAVADLDGDFEISEEEDDYYNSVWQQIPNALLTLGAPEDDVDKLVNGESNAAGQRVGEAVKLSLDSEKADDDDLIAGFAYGEDAVLENADDDPEGRHMVLEAAYKKRKVVRDGKVVVVRKRVSGKIRLSAAQKAGLRKARRKANTGAANPCAFGNAGACNGGSAKGARKGQGFPARGVQQPPSCREYRYPYQQPPQVLDLQPGCNRMRYLRPRHEPRDCRQLVFPF